MTMDTSNLTEGDALLLVQRGFTLPEPAIFLRYYPRGSDAMTETAVFLRSGTLCPVSEWVRYRFLRDVARPEYEDTVRVWAKAKASRKAQTASLMAFFDEMKDYDKWRSEWILSGKLYRNYDHSTVFDEDDPRKSRVVNQVPVERFEQSSDLFVGEMGALKDPEIREAAAAGPHAVVDLVLRRKWFSNECGGGKVIKRFMRDFKDAHEGNQEGQWINLVIKKKCLSAFGLPEGYLLYEGHTQFHVPNYDQLILQCDGKDKARTLGMHRDVYPGSSATHVSTILGCVGGLGKEMLVWRGHPNGIPAWWRQEGLPCELFDYVYKNTDPSILQRIVLKPGQFVFMPRGLWHWVRPIPGAQWTVMVTSSFHTVGVDFECEKVSVDLSQDERQDPPRKNQKKRVLEPIDTGRPRRKCRALG